MVAFVGKTELEIFQIFEIWKIISPPNVKAV